MCTLGSLFFYTTEGKRDSSVQHFACSFLISDLCRIIISSSLSVLFFFWYLSYSSVTHIKSPHTLRVHLYSYSCNLNPFDAALWPSSDSARIRRLSESSFIVFLVTRKKHKSKHYFPQSPSLSVLKKTSSIVSCTEPRNDVSRALVLLCFR